MAHQAVPMLCILKKNSKLRTVFDLWEQNDNLVKDVTPFPDQDIIRNDMARVAYCSKLNMSEAYEQICIVLEHIHKTAFTTVLGTFRSQVMQMGDCNTLYISTTDDCNLSRLHQSICPCIPRQYIHIFAFY